MDNKYEHLRPFRFYCQKVLPLVYDDSLSYYELLCKVVDYLNRVIATVNDLTDDFLALKTLVEQALADMNDKVAELEQYMNDYFNNLDVQEEINNKLDEMSEAGELEALLRPIAMAIINEMISDGTIPEAMKPVITAMFPSLFTEAFNTAFPDKFDEKWNEKFPTEFSESFDRDFAENFPTAFTENFNSSFPTAFEGKWNEKFPTAFTENFNSSFPTAFEGKWNEKFPTAFDEKFTSSFPTAFTEKLNSSGLPIPVSAPWEMTDKTKDYYVVTNGGTNSFGMTGIYRHWNGSDRYHSVSSFDSYNVATGLNNIEAVSKINNIMFIDPNKLYYINSTQKDFSTLSNLPPITYNNTHEIELYVVLLNHANINDLNRKPVFLFLLNDKIDQQKSIYTGVDDGSGTRINWTRIDNGNFSELFTKKFNEMFSNEFASEFSAMFPEVFEASFNEAFPDKFNEYFNTEFLPSFDTAFVTAFNENFYNFFPEEFQKNFNTSFPTAFDERFNSSFPTALKESNVVKTAEKEEANNVDFINMPENRLIDFNFNTATSISNPPPIDNISSVRCVKLANKKKDGTVSYVWLAFCVATNENATFVGHLTDGDVVSLEWERIDNGNFSEMFNEQFTTAFDNRLNTVFTDKFTENFNADFPVQFDESFNSQFPTAFDERIKNSRAVQTIAEEDLKNDIGEATIITIADVPINKMVYLSANTVSGLPSTHGNYFVVKLKGNGLQQSTVISKNYALAIQPNGGVLADTTIVWCGTENTDGSYNWQQVNKDINTVISELKDSGEFLTVATAPTAVTKLTDFATNTSITYTFEANSSIAGLPDDVKTNGGTYTVTNFAGVDNSSRVFIMTEAKKSTAGTPSAYIGTLTVAETSATVYWSTAISLSNVKSFVL